MDVVLTPAAVKFISRMLRFSPSPSGGFRLEVKPGGCSGLASEFNVEATPLPGDQVVEKDGIRLFLPASNGDLLDGVTIDFADSRMESGFVFRDPKRVEGSCGTHAAPARELVSLGKFG
jgi:iron-sulfur cluster assembly protein